MSSSDGFCTLIAFEEGQLGERFRGSDVNMDKPVVLQQATSAEEAVVSETGFPEAKSTDQKDVKVNTIIPRRKKK